MPFWGALASLYRSFISQTNFSDSVSVSKLITLSISYSKPLSSCYIILTCIIICVWEALWRNSFLFKDSKTYSVKTFLNRLVLYLLSSVLPWSFYMDLPKYLNIIYLWMFLTLQRCLLTIFTILPFIHWL